MKKTTLEKLKETKQTIIFYCGQVAKAGELTPEQVKVIANYCQKFIKQSTKAEILRNAEQLNQRAKRFDLYEQKGLTEEELRKGYQQITGLDNGEELTAEEIHAYLLDALKE